MKLLRVAICVVAASACLPAQMVWSQVKPRTLPRPNHGHSMVYDSGRDRIVNFGGVGGTGTFEWDGDTWTQRSPRVSPPNRQQFGLTYDLIRGRTVLFGGAPNQNDTWEWDGTNWQRVTPSKSPKGRCCPMMAYFINQLKVVLFGGYNNGMLGDTWAWDGKNWTQLSPTTSPPARCCGSMAYDAGRGRLVLFGGAKGATSSDFGDTWEWDGINWKQMNPRNSPSPRRGFTMTYDSARGRIVLFGGGVGGLGTTVYNDTWEWDGINWTQTASGGPTARYIHSIVFDARRGRTVLFGGIDYNTRTTFGDMWDYYDGDAGEQGPLDLGREGWCAGARCRCGCFQRRPVLRRRRGLQWNASRFHGRWLELPHQPGHLLQPCSELAEHPDLRADRRPRRGGEGSGARQHSRRTVIDLRGDADAPRLRHRQQSGDTGPQNEWAGPVESGEVIRSLARLFFCVTGVLAPAAFVHAQTALPELVRVAAWGATRDRDKALAELRSREATDAQFKAAEIALRRGRAYAKPTEASKRIEVSIGEGRKLQVDVQWPADYDPKRSYPLMVAMGGGPLPSMRRARQQGQMMAAIWRRPAEKAKWIVATITDSVSIITKRSPLRYPMLTDVHFRAVLDAVQSRFHVDVDRVHATGVSLGSNYALHYAAAHPHWFAGVVPVSTEGESREWVLRKPESCRCLRARRCP